MSAKFSQLSGSKDRGNRGFNIREFQEAGIAMIGGNSS